MPRSSPRSSRAENAVRFIRHLRHTKGEWAGQPFELAPWQEQVIRDLFGELRPDGVRQYRKALIGTPRKNGKTTLGAAIALYLLLADGEPGAEVYSAAADRDQARLVFNTAKQMIEASPLSEHVKVYRDVIAVPQTHSVYKVLSADAYTKHGLSPHGVVFDELHAQPNRELWDVLTSGQGARRQPLTVALTTAGNNRNSIGYEIFDYGQRGTDDRFYFAWWGAGRDDDWTKEKTWRKANPSLGQTITIGFLRDEFKEAKQLPARQNTYRQLYLNEWVQQATRWLDLAKWDATAGIVDETKLRGRTCYGGLDLASTTDIAALCWDFPSDKGHEAIWRFWAPADRIPDLDRRTGGQASGWVRSGFLTATEGDVIDYRAILKQIDEDAQRFDVTELAYDRWGATQLVQDLQEAGMEVVPFGQGFSSMSGPTKEWERLILERQYIHGGNPVMRWMADNITVKTDPAGNIKIDKQKSTEKVDGAIAAVMALDRALRHEGKSIYEERGVVTL